MNARLAALLSLLGFLSATSASIAAPSAGSALAARPYPSANQPAALDLGALSTRQPDSKLSVTVALRMRDSEAAEKLLVAIHTPGDPQFHQFLTAAQFNARFAPSAADVARYGAALTSLGLSVERTSALTLKVTGRTVDVERAFAVKLHAYQVPAQGPREGYEYHAPLGQATLPAVLGGAVSAVAGLDSRPAFHPHLRPAGLNRPPASTSSSSGNPPGYWTVLDFAQYYDVQPLYNRGITGKGRTVGIVTLASFTPSDAFDYWSALGLAVNPDRLTIVDVDGGPGAPSDASGSDETTLDVQQSGGIAPGAQIRVYQAPNTNQGFIDAFAQATEDNQAQSVSVSWGFWEWFNNLANAPVTDPVSGRTVGFNVATHEQLVRAALQGQSFFAASGDSGAYDATGDIGCTQPYSSKTANTCTAPLTVDYPAADTAITAAGGTTLAGAQTYCLDSACTQTYSVNVPHERVWGWDYLTGLCQALGLSIQQCGIFPAGGGGGISVLSTIPGYQAGLPGTQRSQAGQVWRASPDVGTTFQVGTFFALPGNYPGRNVPDISFNADPETGYSIYYTSNVNGFGILYAGGTSFVAPQLNGVTALLGELTQGRLGLLNYPLYFLAQTGRAYGGPNAPVHAIRYGNNWYWYGSNGYNQGVGLGTLDVANFARLLGNE